MANLHARIDEGLKVRLAAQAAAEQRSLTQVLIRAIERYVLAAEIERRSQESHAGEPGAAA